MANAKVSWVSGTNGKYVLHVEPTQASFSQFDGIVFSVYREAQNVANAIKWGAKNMQSLRDRYEIYAEQARQLGWVVKTFDEWLNS